MSKGNFFKQVYKVARQIPKGKVTTYGHIAEYLGSKGSARMLGWAMNSSFSSDIPIPAHRVVNRNGMLTGKAHFQTVDMMEKLLEKEGVEIVDDKIMNFKKILWIPLDELH